MAVEANKGDCVLWTNGKLDAAQQWRKEAFAQHYGECIRPPNEGSGSPHPHANGGSKFVAVQWLRANPYDWDEELSVGAVPRRARLRLRAD